jgi:hypothetical protein
MPVKNRAKHGLARDLANYYEGLEMQYAPGSAARAEALGEFEKRRKAKETKNRGGKRTHGRMTGENILTGLLVAKTQSRLANLLYRELCKVFIKPQG